MGTIYEHFLTLKRLFESQAQNLLERFCERAHRILRRWFWVPRLLVCTGLLLLAFNLGSHQDLALMVLFWCFLLGGVVRLAQWLVSLFLEGVRRIIRRVELIVNTTLTLFFLSALITREVLIRTLTFLFFLYVAVGITLIILTALWFKIKEIRERNKDWHTTLCIALGIFTIYFFFEVVPPYDNPNAYFTSRFYRKADVWMLWAFERVIRWFSLSGF